MKENAKYWSELMSKLSDSYKQWFEDEKQFQRKHIFPNAKVLDVGCGEGRNLNYIIDITKHLTGIDHSNLAISEAKENLPSVKFIKADAEQLPFEDNEFDFGICMTSFANFGENKYKILEEMKRVGKKIIISVFNEDAFDERMKVYKNDKASIVKIKKTTVFFDDGETSEQFSQQELEDIFNKVSLKILEIKKVNIAYLCLLSQ